MEVVLTAEICFFGQRTGPGRGVDKNGLDMFRGCGSDEAEGRCGTWGKGRWVRCRREERNAGMDC